jgi:glycosidase
MRSVVTAVVLYLFVACGFLARAQDSVDVTFRYQIAGKTGVSVPGEFNGWSSTAMPMTNAGGDVWTRTVRLRLGGNPAPPAVGIPGAWQYKFYYTGASQWPNDPLNHHQNAADNSNSFLYLKDPTIYQFLPNQRMAVVTTPTPKISAYVFPRVGGIVDTSTIKLVIDGVTISGIGSGYDSVTKQFVYTPVVALSNGDHSVVLQAGGNADTVRFTVQGGYAQITTRGGYSTYDGFRVLRGLVQDTAVHAARLVRNGNDTTLVNVAGGIWSAGDTLSEGANSFVLAVDSSGAQAYSSPVVITRSVSHAPVARASAARTGSSVTLSAAGSTDPDGPPPTVFVWKDDPVHPLGLNGTAGVTAAVALPAIPGEYYFGLIAVDPQGNADTTRSYFVLNADGTVVNPGYADNPGWVRQARVYFLFPRAASAEGNLAGARQRLSAIRDLGFNVIWLMPVMQNASPINMGTGPGYNITDFYNVATEYGSNQDMKDFVQQAHSYGMKVILDITPNHSSRSHTWAVDARAFGQDSRYWTWYEHSLIPHNTNGLGQSLDAYGFAYYSGFSDQLLDLNWNDLDLRMEMIRMFKYWLLEFGVDGFRFDVYWGPHRRYGEAAMGFPVRSALKHVKPDIFLLAEDDGTGSGTETIYADYEDLGVRGGVDAAYDFRLYFNQIRSFAGTENALTNLHNDILNAGFYPGPHALYMRFMESQDEDRIVYFYGANSTIDPLTTFRKTMPMASVIFTAPGFPMLWNGQEVGFGYGIQGSKEARARSTIDWNYQGRPLLAPHYQKLATLRGAFPAFTAHKHDTNGDGAVNAADDPDFVRVTSSNPIVYAFIRPYRDQNGLTVVNASGAEQSTTLDLGAGGALIFNEDLKNQDPIFANDLLSSVTQTVNLVALSSFQVALPAYGSAVYTISLTRDTLKVANPITSVEGQKGQPAEFGLEQNYPNPFNPSTRIGYTIAGPGHEALGTRRVNLSVYDVLGREVAVLVNEEKAPGTYTVQFDGRPLSSGVYFYRLTASGEGTQRVDTRKMIMVK